MSDAPAPGPSPDESDDAAEPAAPDAAAPEVPTGEPDGTRVDEAAGDEPGPADGHAAEPASDADAPPTGRPDGTAGAEATATGDPVPATDLAGEVAEVRRQLAEVRGDLADARAGIEAFLPDLAASAREETLSHGLADLAREETVASGNARLQKGMDEMVRLTRRADEHVAELHAENQRLRAGELASATLPMIRDLVRLHDEVAQLASASHPEAQADLQLVGSRLLDTLARWGLTPFSPAPGDPLDARRHQGVGRVASADGDPGTVAAVRRPGFAHDDGRTFRAAEVEVFVAPDPAEAAVVAAPPAPPAPPAEATVVVDPPAPPPEPAPPAPPAPDPGAGAPTEE